MSVPSQITVPIPAKSIIRTIVPIALGFGVSLLAHVGIKNPVYVSAIGSAAAAVYYTIVRTLEVKYPKLGLLLGAIGAPTYPSALPKSAGTIPSGPFPSPMATATGSTTPPIQK